MPFEVAVMLDGEPAAAGNVGAEQPRLDLELPPLPSGPLPGLLRVGAADGSLPSTASASCISEWVRCGAAAVSGNTVEVPLRFDAADVLGSRDRPRESTVYLSLDGVLLRLVLKVPSLAPAPTAAAAAAREEAPPAPAAGAGDTDAAPPPAAPEPLEAIPASPAAGPPPPSGADMQLPGAPRKPDLHPAASAPAAGPEAFPAAGACRDHPHAPASGPCARCGHPYCAQCLVELQGARLCGWCKEAVLAQLQQRAAALDPAHVLIWARVYDGALAFSGLVGMGMGAFAQALSGSVSGTDPGALRWALGLLPGLLAVCVAVPPAVGLGPGRRWAYAWQLAILIPSALLSCFWVSCFGVIFWPAGIALMVYMLRPEVRQYCEGGFHG